MGMAASQARFLGLTARKSNVEFEGQQINQQRTTLSNESANYYNDLLGMTVPTPPSIDNYTKIVYTFKDGALTNEITSLIAQANGTYTLSYLSKWQEDYVPVAASTSVVNVQNGNYYIGASPLRTVGAVNGSQEDYPEFAGKSDTEIQKILKEELAWAQMLEEKYGTPADQWVIRYTKNTTTGQDVPYFYQKPELEKGAQTLDENGNILSNINCYTIGSAQKAEEIKAVEGCMMERDTTGRFISINIPNQFDEDGNIIGYTEYALTTSTVTDHDAYDDAMNAYEYEKYLYDQAIDQINAKIEIVQAEDKNLELRLKQLDTEQNAIQTEIDAVSKVIEKNTESSFKTFG